MATSSFKTVRRTKGSLHIKMPVLPGKSSKNSNNERMPQLAIGRSKYKAVLTESLQICSTNSTFTDFSSFQRT
ncbi:hypothetical protein BpHYR1_018243 [Brachionus plicatilis]|uniref:Uncharacterized protein n=1 Tax=Brachionus plicatilis TaxID=10195 RepID=A0A3M7QWZ3_BRAPC|nr:hypothetical protein BpHYR1_018243 [Brachionus plicatilis]